MRSLLLLKRFINGGALVSQSSIHNPLVFAAAVSATNSPLPFCFSSRRNAVSMTVLEDEAEITFFLREAPGISYGLNWALAERGVIVKDKAFRNLKPYELQQKGAIVVGPLSGLPLYVRGNVLGESSGISKSQFSKLLKQVTAHLSSISDIFVHDGAVGSSSRCDAKVRIVSDSPSAVYSLSSLFWATSTRAVSHDSCPLTIYAASTISLNADKVIDLGARGNNGFIAADVEHFSLILCGKAFTDAKGIKEALFALSGPIISSRGGLLLSAGLLKMGDSVVLLFAPKDVINSCSDKLVSVDAGVVLSSEGASPLFASGKSEQSYLPILPAAVVIVSCDSSGTVPSRSKLSPGQAAFHFLAGYQNGKFMPTNSKGPSAIDPLELAKVFMSKLKDNQIPSFLVNTSGGEKEITGNELIKLVQSTLCEKVPPFEPKGGDLQEKYKTLSSRYKELPEEFSF